MNQTLVPTKGRPLGRRLALGLLCVLPLALLGGAWVVVDRLLLTPAEPTPASDAPTVVHFVAHDKGLTRFDDKRKGGFLDKLIERLTSDAAFRGSLLRELARAPAETRKAFQRNLLLAIKPRLIGDAQQLVRLEGEARLSFLDQRVVEYSRLHSALRGERGPGSSLSSLMPERDELTRLMLSLTNDEERVMATVFLTDYAARLAEIKDHPELQAELRARFGDFQP